MDRETIQRYLPHRDPFLLIDRITEIERDRRVVAERDVRPDEPWFAGHFPGAPVLPGVLIVESMAQAAGVLAFWSADVTDEKAVYFTSIDKTRFRKPVLPGATLRLELELVRRRGLLYRFQGHASVGDDLVAESRIHAVRGTGL